MQLARPYSGSACEPTRALVMYCVPVCIAYMCCFVGELVFVVRVSVPFASLRRQVACCLPQVRCLFGEGLAIGSKTDTEACFVKKAVLGCRSCSRGENWQQKKMAKKIKIKLMVPVLR